MHVLKLYRNICLKIYSKITTKTTKIIFWINGARYDKLLSIGVPSLRIGKKSHFLLGKDVVIVNGAKYSMLGKVNKSRFTIFDCASITIGNKVGMSNVTMIASNSITLGNNILIGGGVTIVDTDFHSLNPIHWHTDQDAENMKSVPVIIGNNVFIGMDAIILKGVSIGNNSIVASGSVVSKSIPIGEVWGGNPAKFIRKNVS
jgi:acetyltransferase-like isoleucine patch superfamily enzyme